MLRSHSRNAALVAAHPYSNRWLASLSNAAATVRVWLWRSRSRRELAGLEDHVLSDIGVSRAQAWYESQKPFWRP